MLLSSKDFLTYRITGKIWRVLYLANEPFERNWRILIWRLRRCYYSTDVAVCRKSLIWRFLIWRQRSKSPNLNYRQIFPLYGTVRSVLCQ